MIQNEEVAKVLDEVADMLFFGVPLTPFRGRGCDHGFSRCLGVGMYGRRGRKTN
jgi:hypothetical protein